MRCLERQQSQPALGARPESALLSLSELFFTNILFSLYSRVSVLRLLLRWTFRSIVGRRQTRLFWCLSRYIIQRNYGGFGGVATKSFPWPRFGVAPGNLLVPVIFRSVSLGPRSMPKKMEQTPFWAEHFQTDTPEAHSDYAHKTKNRACVCRLIFLVFPPLQNLVLRI